MADRENSGIVVSGGTFNAQNFAVGANSRVQQANWSEPLARPLADLQSAIDAFQGSQATRDALIAAHTEIAEELAAPAPDKNKILAKLASLSRLAGPTVTIVQAVAALAQVIATIL